jgi:phage baseplate assembly protein W
MAIELGKVNVTDLTENDYKILGIAINKSSNIGGIFAVNYTTLSQAKDNLKNLILTKKGERLQNPEFGCDIWNLIFEQITEEDLNIKIENSILDAVKKWLPYLQIQEIIFDYDDRDIDANTISLEILFALISNPSLKDTLNINVNN